MQPAEALLRRRWLCIVDANRPFSQRRSLCHLLNERPVSARAFKPAYAEQGEVQANRDLRDDAVP